MPRLRPGLMIHDLTVERATESISKEGKPVKSWADITVGLAGSRTISAQITPTVAREYRRNGQVTGDITHEVGVWHLDGLLITDRLRHAQDRKRIFNIIGIVNVDERDVEDVIVVKESALV